MKWLLSLTVAAGFATAAVTPNAAGQPALKRTLRPHRSLDIVTTQDVGTPSVVRDKANLVPVPPAFKAVPRKAVRRQLTAQDFYECSSSTPAPAPADCAIITDSLLDTTQQLLVAGGSCLVFSYQTCAGFFCALCAGEVATSTGFVGQQLGAVEALCDGATGTIVGEDAPQWEAGFVGAGAPLPDYNVC